MGNVYEVMSIIHEALRMDAIESSIVTEDDMEIYIDDWVFRVHIEADLAS